MKVRLVCALLLVLIIDHLAASGIPRNYKQDTQMNDKRQMTRSNRSKRSLATLFDAWIGAMATTGLRISYFPEQIWHDIFGDKPKKEMERMKERIEEEQKRLIKLQEKFKKMAANHHEEKAYLNQSLDKLKVKYEEDVGDAMREVKNSRLMIRLLCGDDYNCAEYSIDLTQNARLRVSRKHQIQIQQDPATLGQK